MSAPSQASEGTPKKEIIIVGAGIVGVCTAYYLTQHPSFSKETHHITILEARRPAGAASGKAGGLLAMWAFPQQIVPLSFRLHEQLAEEYNGAAEWGYRGLKTLCIEGNISSSHLRNIRNGVVKSNTDIDLPDDLDWVTPEIIDGWTNLGDADSTAQVHPYKFTLFILKKVLETGAVDLITGKVIEVTTDADGVANGVVYLSSASDKHRNQTSILQNFRQQQPSPQKESTTSQASKAAAAAGTGATSSPKKQQNRSSLHHPDNPTFNNNPSHLAPSTSASASKPLTPESSSSNTFRGIHNSSYSNTPLSATSTKNTTPSISESSEESANLSTDDDESILDGSIASSEESEELVSGVDNEDIDSLTTGLKSTDEGSANTSNTSNNNNSDPATSGWPSLKINENPNDKPNDSINENDTTNNNNNITNNNTKSRSPFTHKSDSSRLDTPAFIDNSSTDNNGDQTTASSELHINATEEEEEGEEADVKERIPAGKVKTTLEGDQIVLTLGPWTSKLLPSCPISGLRAHSITIQPSKQVSPFALFTEMRTSRTSYVSPEIYPRRDEVYVCGEGDTFAEVPETSDDVEVLRDRCDELFKHVGEISSNLKNGRILKRQACYLPVVDVPSHSGPFIGPTNVDNLYLASGHSCWGINNAPATGLLLSEILLEGEAKSASVDGLEPEFYFDASLKVV
ncbi:uncharacterized protein SAPINGB_P001095 [Magnusiomyces paraingens]|uniref:FAD dependent oxidoreductase domain-containing protein n=1 Tax=Magnusiomyces paraingens TaxID=2606893 RepID=A0A5E8B3Z2_9ASCO|nr:uncharacterized protein SAPINGB_P001095 [Saprochaete ingens]VVT46199.1 unnamed protein product [Saprochaete ingens]